jgi:hypothetical protein
MKFLDSGSALADVPECGIAEESAHTPGPFPAVYEEIVSPEGIASYALMRGLVIAARGSELTRPTSQLGYHRRCESPARPSPG